MVKIEAITLESAYAKAAEQLECSVTELEVEIIQSPKKGFLNLFKKSAIIVATCKKGDVTTSVRHEVSIEVSEPLKEIEEERVPDEHITVDDHAVEGFFDEQLPSNEIVNEVHNDINNLFTTLCFDIETIAVSLYDETTLLVEFSGKDAALLIGKEGYRYKALSYMIFNWINSKYHMQLRLEIAEFLKNQEEAMERYLEGVRENIDRDGRAQTKVLDGVLVQIALRELRASYPDKYVAIRSTRDGAKFIIINDYNEY